MGPEEVKGANLKQIYIVRKLVTIIKTKLITLCCQTKPPYLHF